LSKHEFFVRRFPVSRLDVPTVLLQWATGGLFFLWVTTRHRLVGLGYGWLMRGVFAVIAALAVLTNGGARSTGRTVCAALMVVAALVVLAVSIVRKGAGVSRQRDEADRKKERVAEMLASAEPGTAAMQMRDQFGRVSGEVERTHSNGPEFPPVLDLIAPAIGAVGLVFGGAAAGGVVWLSVLRVLVGALFLGAVSDAMLLGHWYLVQPGLTRRPIVELNDWLLKLWPIEVIVMLIPTGMISVITGAVDDKWNGYLGWMWIACALTTGILAVVTRIILKERFYSAVMAATGMLYLSILTAFGTDIVARAVLQ
jgi:hypothetical protein